MPNIRNILRSFISALALFFIISPSFSQTKKEPPERAQHKQIPLKQVSISGQVFIVTKGADNKKLALVNISAYQESDFLQQLNDIEVRDRGLRVKAFGDYQAEKEIYERAGQDLKEVSDLMLKGAPGSSEAEKNWQRATKVQTESISAYYAAKESFERLSSNSYYFSDLTKSPWTSKTDADGNFELRLPPGKYVLTASSSRSVVGSVEQYYWAVHLNVTGSDKKIMLSNDNLAETRCSDCIAIPDKAIYKIEEDPVAISSFDSLTKKIDDFFRASPKLVIGEYDEREKLNLYHITIYQDQDQDAPPEVFSLGPNSTARIRFVKLNLQQKPSYGLCGNVRISGYLMGWASEAEAVASADNSGCYGKPTSRGQYVLVYRYIDKRWALKRVRYSLDGKLWHAGSIFMRAAGMNFDDVSSVALKNSEALKFNQNWIDALNQ